MRISSFFESFNTKTDKLDGLADIINELASRFQDLGTKVSCFPPQTECILFLQSFVLEWTQCWIKNHIPRDKM